jgi:hypothetical protein
MQSHDSSGGAPSTRPDPTIVPSNESASTQVEAPDIEPPLDGLWLRSERERLAMSRRVVAARLQVRESRLVNIELMNRPVPTYWLSGLASLGIRVPAEFSLPPPAVVESAPAPVERPVEPAAAKPSSLAREVLRGHVIRRQRYKLNLALRLLSGALGVSPQALGMLEANDLVVPPWWLPALKKHRVSVTAEQERAAYLFSEPYPRGAWLRAQREQRGHSSLSLAARLHVPPSVFAIVETQDWPLPPEWLPLLSSCGFIIPELVEQIVEKQVVAQKRVHKERPPTKPLSGAWLRRHRSRKNLTQGRIGEYLKVTASAISLCERRNQTVPDEWISGLRELGFPIPPETAVVKAPPPPAPVVKAPPATPPAAPSREKLDGSWMRLHRERLRRTIEELSNHLMVTAATLRRAEKYNVSIPVGWLPGLRSFGFPIPSGYLDDRRHSTVAPPVVPPPVVAPPAAASPVVESTASTIKLVEKLITSRTQLGRSSSQPPLEVLSLILGDLREAGLEPQLRYEDVEAALQLLLRPFRKA